MTAIVLTACMIATVQVDSRVAAELLEIRELHEANQATMTYGALRFEYTVGSAKTASDARNGEFQNSRTARGRYLFDVGRALIEVLHEPTEMAAARRKTSPNQYTSSISSYRALTDGNITLMDYLDLAFESSEVIHHPYTAGAETFFRYTRLPLNLGDPSPRLSSLLADLDGCLSGQFPLVSLEPMHHAGEACLYIKMQKPAGTTEYWIDSKRGAIPLKMVEIVTEHGYTFEEYLDDLRPNNRGGWFPRILTLCTNQLSRVERCVITSAEFETPPPDTAFRLEFPEPVPVLDKLKGERRPPSKLWALSDLHTGSGQPLHLGTPPPQAPDLPTEGNGSPLWPIGLAVFLSVAVLIGLRLVWRR
jgi:hypothetical protein